MAHNVLDFGNVEPVRLKCGVVGRKASRLGSMFGAGLIDQTVDKVTGL